MSPEEINIIAVVLAAVLSYFGGKYTIVEQVLKALFKHLGYKDKPQESDPV